MAELDTINVEINVLNWNVCIVVVDIFVISDKYRQNAENIFHTLDLVNIANGGATVASYVEKSAKKVAKIFVLYSSFLPFVMQ